MNGRGNQTLIYITIGIIMLASSVSSFTSIRFLKRSPQHLFSMMSTSPGGSYTPELLVSIQAARRAAIAAKGLQKSLLQGKSAAISKTDSSPVTIADFSVQALVVNEIRRSFPTDQVVAEETSSVLGQDPQALQAVTDVVSREGIDGPVNSEHVCKVLDHGRSANRRTWILDPIDGTKGYIRGEHFCVALGLAVEGKPILGVLGCPNVPLTSSRENGAKLGDGCLFFAVQGQGAYVLPLQPSGAVLEDELAKAQKIKVSDVATGGQARFFESFESAHSSHSVAADVNKELGVSVPPVRLDSQCKYGMLARGEGEIMLRLPRPGYIENIWDHAPAYVVITEAGGKVSDTSGKELDFSRGCKTGDGKLGADVTGVVTTNGKIHDEVLDALKKAGWPS